MEEFMLSRDGIETAMKKKGYDVRTTAMLAKMSEKWLEEAIVGERKLTNMEMLRLSGVLGTGVADITSH